MSSIRKYPAAKRILIVEDEPHIQELISVNLTRAGHAVRCAPDAEQAREMLVRWMPDLMLLDILLPDTEGYLLLERLKGDERWRDVPVLMLSSCPTAASTKKPARGA